MSNQARGAFLASDERAIVEIARRFKELTGVILTERHHTMVASRLTGRVAELGLTSLSEYLDYLDRHLAEENPKLVGLLTTHHTYFFREFAHFEFLRKTALPSLLQEVRKRQDKTLRVLVAACSRGQEAYSLAMLLDQYLKGAPDLRYQIEASDVDPESVAVARNGVYPWAELSEVPMSLLGSHWIKGKGEIANFAKAADSIRSRCTFSVANLLEPKSTDLKRGHYDIIFCRNVFIYFGQPEVKRATEHLLAQLTQEGFLFVGISESVNNLGLAIESKGPSIYQRKGVKTIAIEKGPTEVLPVAAPARLRVVCVDDSPTILALLKQILVAEQGFEVVGTAKNGLEASQVISAAKPDVVTLDIHMPEQTGIEYLERNFRPGHPPVVMITSVSREDSVLAGKALRLGAADFIEKPSLANLAQRADEIRMKVLSATQSSGREVRAGAGLALQFQSPSQVAQPENKICAIVFPLSARATVKSLVETSGSGFPQVFLLCEGLKDARDTMAEELSRTLGRVVVALDQVPDDLRSGVVALADFESFSRALWARHPAPQKPWSIQLLGHPSQGVVSWVRSLSGVQVLAEDVNVGRQELRSIATDIVPATSFAYLASQYFARFK